MDDLDLINSVEQVEVTVNSIQKGADFVARYSLLVFFSSLAFRF